MRVFRRNGLIAQLNGSYRQVLGLIESYEGKHPPLVAGVHTIPDYSAKVDYEQP